MERFRAEIKEKNLTFPEQKIGAHRVDLVLRDGRVIEDVVVAWGDDVARIGRGDPYEFSVQDVVDAIRRTQGGYLPQKTAVAGTGESVDLCPERCLELRQSGMI